ncbi:MAG TPA: hypothetical protein VE079_13050, partial [Ensifer sp.]|nr:hypothetical protein [Ensifer sp.]
KRCNTPAPIFPCNPDQPVRSGLIGVPYGGLADILTLQIGGHFNVHATCSRGGFKDEVRLANDTKGISDARNAR